PGPAIRGPAPWLRVPSLIAPSDSARVPLRRSPVEQPLFPASADATAPMPTQTPLENRIEGECFGPYAHYRAFYWITAIPLVFVRYRAGHIHHGQEHEDVCLQ